MSSTPTPSRDQDRDDRATIAVFTIVMAIVIAALYYVGRTGFDNPAFPVVHTLGLSLFIGVSPFVVWRFSLRGAYDEPVPWWRSQAAFTIAAIALTAAGGMLVPTTGWNLIELFALIGFASAIIAVFIWLRQGSQLANAIFVTGVAAFAVWASAMAWSTRYKTPVFWETLEYHADVHHDPLYNVAMANTMRSYGVPSTGIDGAPYNFYHYGSGWLNSQWAYLVRSDVLGFYSLGPAVIVIPLFFASILLLAVEARKSGLGSGARSDRPLKTDYAAWFFFVAASIGLIPSSGLDALGIWNRHAMISESYVTGVPVFMLGLATGISYWRRRRASLSPSDVVFLLVFVPAILVVLGFLKVSLMLLAIAAGLGVVTLGRLYRDRWVLASVVLSFIGSVVTYRLVSVAAQNQGIVPFAFVRFAGVSPAWWPYFILLHLFWSWLYIYLRIREEKLSSIGALRHAALEGRITDVLVIAIVAIAGVLPGELIDIHGGSAIYFSDVQRWLALSVLMASAWRWLEGWRQSAEQSATGSRIAGIRLSRVWIAIIAVPISITMILNLVRAPATALRAELSLRRALVTQAGVSGPIPVRSLADRSALAAGLQKSPAYPLISTLRRLDSMPRAVKRRTVVFIPQSNLRFWHIWPEAERCSFVPFIVPAAAGLALIDGMPPVDCNLTNQYGMTRYRRRTKPQLPSDVMPVAICAKAVSKGFSRVVVLDGSDQYVTLRAIECPVRMAAPIDPGRGSPRPVP